MNIRSRKRKTDLMFDSFRKFMERGNKWRRFLCNSSGKKKFHFQVSPIHAKWTVAEEIEEGRKGEEKEEPAVGR